MAQYTLGQFREMTKDLPDEMPIAVTDRDFSWEHYPAIPEVVKSTPVSCGDGGIYYDSDKGKANKIDVILM